MANHRKFAVTFEVLALNEAGTNGGFRYEREQDHGDTDIRLSSEVALGLSLLQSGDDAGKVRLAMDGDALIGVGENLESDMRIATMTHGVCDLPIGNDSTGAAYALNIGDLVVGALGSLQGVADADVDATTQMPGFVRPIDRTVADIGATVNQTAVNDVITDIENSLAELTRGMRAICISTRTPSASRTRNGTATIMFH